MGPSGGSALDLAGGASGQRGEIAPGAAETLSSAV